MLLCLDWKREGSFKTVNLGIISVLGAAVLAAYIKNPERFYLCFLLLMIILLLFYLWYGPQRRRRKIAERIIRSGGSFQMVIGDGYIETAEFGKTALEGRKLKFYISQNLYIIKADRNVYAVPKRILGRQQEERLTGLMRRYEAETIHVLIKKE